MRWALVVVLVPFALTAGCVAEADQEPAAAAPDPLPFGAQALGASGNETLDVPEVAPLTRDDWLVLPLTASADGGFAGFRFTVPAGASVPTWYDEETKHVVLELAIVGNGSADVLHVLAGQAGQVLAESTSYAEASGWGASVNEKSFNGGLRGDQLSVEVEEGQEMFLAAAAIGAGDATLGVRFAPKDPFKAMQDGDDGAFAPSDGKEFLSRVEGKRALHVTPVAQGIGFQAGFLYDSHRLTTVPSSQHFEYGALRVESTTPATPVQPLTLLTATAQSPAGPGYASGAFWMWNEAHVGQVDATLVTPDGTTTSVAGPVVPDPVVQSTIALARGDGEAAASLQAAVEMAGAPTMFPQLLVISYVHVDMQLADLVGEPIDGQSEAYDSAPVLLAHGRMTTRA